MRASSVLAAILAVLAPGALRAQDPSPYAGEEGRAIAALSEEEVAGLLAGEGMGYAKAAELNGYPGPKHALDLADSLGLTGEQRAALEAIRGRMRDRALPLGRAIVDAETALDRAFGARTIDAAGLARATAGIARLEGELRAAHLEAHLATRAVLTEAQIARYDALRGYAAAGDHAVHAH